ncbi:acetate--CoA ligase [Candidatus Woesearchaeota archaeon]|nr:acetate--CoA ligase [Candidatus Woesearchaeota archaeon]
MKVETIKKNKKDLVSPKPNLESYEKEYKKFNWKTAEKEVEWFGKDSINAAYNAVTRHALSSKRHKVALLWESDTETKHFTFAELDDLSNKFANVLQGLGVKKGDRVFIFLTRVPALYVSFLGILKLGAIAGTLFCAFGPDALKDRLLDSGAKIVITEQSLKDRVEKVKPELPALEKMIILEAGQDMKDYEVDYNKLMSAASDKFDCVKTQAEDCAFMLYTSGTTGKPKGVMHAHKAIVQQHMTAKWVLDIHDEDMYWCTADPGWVTGISYTILGIWSNATTSYVYSGRFDPDKWYSLLQKHKVTIWYTAPTAIRMLMGADPSIAKKYDLSNVRHACSVGEPLNPEAVRWGLKELNILFHDNWWQTETGAMMVSNYRCMDIKPGSMGRPMPGIKVGIIDDTGKPMKPMQEGNLAAKPGWPSMMRQIWNNEEKYNSYFKNGWYLAGDRAKMDKDGYVWFIGRADDVIKTAGERVGPFEVESTLVSHPAVAEAGVIGKPDPVRGEIIKAFVTLKAGFQESDALKKEIQDFVKTKLAAHAVPREIEFKKNLPKTRSGKIMRRLLKAQELGLPIGDTSTLEDY